MNKQIANIVFYNFFGENGKMEQACIFFEDGTVKNVSLEEGIEAAYKLASAERINANQFTSMLNKEKIYTMSGKEFERRFQEFIGVPKKQKTTPVDPIIPSIPINKQGGNNKKPTEPQTTPKEDDTKKPIIPPVDIDKPKDTDEDVKDTSKKKKKKKKRKGIFNNIKTRIVAGFLAIAMLVTGGAFALKRCSKEGDINSNNIGTSISTEGVEPQDQAYIALLEKTKNQDQKTAMTKQGKNLDAFNRDFANAHIEKGKSIKPALTWDETMALNLAYNTYTKDQIKAMFNGAEVNSKAMADAYKNATLQAAGAYVIETRKSPVNTSEFLNNEEHKKFAEKYHELFLKCKETTGEEQIKAVNSFYAELYKDFPISDEIREEGISHAEGRKQLEQYKLVVTPMVAAAEMMFQNLKIDHTLSDKAIAYFNDLGLCNMAEEQFEKIETITLTATTDKDLPLYEEFKATKIAELTTEENYGITDKERDLSQLDAFKYWVNGEYLKKESTTGVKDNSSSKKTQTTSTKKQTSTKTETKKTSTSNRGEAVDAVGEEAVKKAESKVDQQINAENEKNKAEAEQKAEANRQEMQAAADKDASKLHDEVNASNKQFQDILDNLNGILSSGGSVSEKDFGDFNVDFEPGYTDASGALKDSVTNITTDPSGYQPGTSLPNPNDTGKKFDGEQSSNQSNSNSTGNGYTGNENAGLPDPNETGREFDEEYSNSSNANDSNNNAPSNNSNNGIFEYEEEYAPDTVALVDAYVESLDGVGQEETAKQLTYK